MKKISIIAAAAAFVALFAVAATPAHAIGAFNFTSTLTPTSTSPLLFSGTAGIQYLPSTSYTSATITTKYVASVYEVLLNNVDVFNGTVTVNSPVFLVATGAAGTFTADAAIPGQLTGSFAPAPEASSVLGLGAMLAAGALALFAAKRKSSSTIA